MSLDTSNPAEIKFYKANEKPYGALSNLYKCKVVFDGIEYPSSEHAYQAAKARDPLVRDWILAAPKPSLVAMAAHNLYHWDVVPDWQLIKVARMHDVLRAKFSQNAELRQILLSTGKARLVEASTTNSPLNKEWGEVYGKGQNLLGKLLMEVREELRDASE